MKTIVKIFSVILIVVLLTQCEKEPILFNIPDDYFLKALINGKFVQAEHLITKGTGHIIPEMTEHLKLELKHHIISSI